MSQNQTSVRESLEEDHLPVSHGEMAIHASPFYRRDRGKRPFAFLCPLGLGILVLGAPAVAQAPGLQSPVESGRCRFNPGGDGDYRVRNHPLLGGRHQHTGVDLGAAPGTEYRAPGDGVITAIRAQGSSERCGQIIEIRHDNGLYTHSCHMQAGGFPRELTVGTRVRQGQVVARIGNTGTSGGPHSHFVVKRQAGLGDANGHMDPYEHIGEFCGVPRSQARPSEPAGQPAIPSTQRRSTNQ